MTRNSRLAAGLALALGLGACSDGPSESTRQVLAAVEASAGNGQAALTGDAVAVAPAVIVTDSRGQAVNGATVQFVVTRGGGTVERTRTLSDPTGIATAGQWRLGEVGVNEVEARVGSFAPVRFTATSLAQAATQPPPISSTGTSSYQIEVRFINAVSARQSQAVSAAVNRWSSVIVRDLADIPVDLAAAYCFPNQPRINERVDDLLLYVEFVAIDGPGQVLGESGPCIVRSENRLPIIGFLKLDTADLLRMEQGGTLDDVVLHEMGHILGIGTLWEDKNLLSGAGTTDPRFLGGNAINAFTLMGGAALSVAVENTGGQGTADGHWRESTFGNELMTGYIGSLPNPLSALTIASLQDLGYGASSSAASSYVLGGGYGHVTTSPVDLRGREKLHKPKLKLDRRGKKVD